LVWNFDMNSILRTEPDVAYPAIARALRGRVPDVDDDRVTSPDDVPTITDGVVTLRAHTKSDVDGIVEQAVDPVSVEWTRVPVPFTRTDALGYLDRMAAGWRSRTEYGFAVEFRGAFGGSVSLSERGDGVAEVSYGLHPAARGHGVCRRAVKLLLDWGFRRYEVVVWQANVGNWASRRAAWACGFSFDGTVRELLVQRGERRDAWLGSLRASDDRTPKHRWNVPPVLSSARLRLRPVVEADAERLGEIVRDPRSRHFGGRVRGVRELSDGAAAVQRILLAQAAGDRYDWTMAEPGSDRLVGHIQLFDLDGLDESEAKLGYDVHPASRGKGVLREALPLVVEWAFRPVADGGLGRRRLSLTTAASNTASRYAVEQVGFTHVGTEPLAFTIGESGFDDMAIYHRLNPNWSAEATNSPA
jgi:ribosomal-protein-alanine N-acetyltransferase